MNNDWEKQFDKEFGIIGQITSNLDLDDYHQYLHQDIKSFIQSLLNKQREELREWAKEKHIRHITDSDEPNEYEKGVNPDWTDAVNEAQIQITGYNQALEDLLTKLEEANEET